MVDTLGLPTICIWAPELVCLVCPEDPESRSSRTKAVTANQAIADWFFYHQLTPDVHWSLLCGNPRSHWLLDSFWMAASWQSPCAWLGMASKCSWCGEAFVSLQRLWCSQERDHTICRWSCVHLQPCWSARWKQHGWCTRSKDWSPCLQPGVHRGRRLWPRPIGPYCCMPAVYQMLSRLLTPKTNPSALSGISRLVTLTMPTH